MKKIMIQYFAIIKDFTGKSEEVIETNASIASDLLNEIFSKYKFTIPQSQLRVAINDDFCDWGQLLKEGDKIVFIPPVSGG